MKTLKKLVAGCIALVVAPVTADDAVNSVWDTSAPSTLMVQVTDLISVPYHFNGSEHSTGESFQGTDLSYRGLSQTPLGTNWNLYSGTSSLDYGNVENGDDDGLETVQSMYFSPSPKGQSGIVWGVGPALVLPGAGESVSANRWGAGPSGMVMGQWGRWSGGALARHIWTVDEKDGNGNETWVQPFVSYTTNGSWTYMLNTESSYDWDAEQWSIPIDAVISKQSSDKGQLFQVGAGLRYWADSPEGGPDGLGFRAFAILRFR